jgi:hypothetical protein
MSVQTLGELWISLHPTEEEIRDCDSCFNYQQLIILEIIEQFGFDRQVFIEPAQTGELGCIPIVLRHLHQLIHLNHMNNNIVIQDIPKVMEERLYPYKWSERYTFQTITYTSRSRNNHQ